MNQDSDNLSNIAATAPVERNESDESPECIAPGSDHPQAVLQIRERQLDAIRKISQALFSHAHVDDMVRETLTVAIEVLEADVGSVQLHDPHDDTLVFRYVLDPAAENLIGRSTPTSQGIGGHVFRTGKAELTEKTLGEVDFNRTVDDLTGYRTESMLTAPLKRYGGQPIGVMQVLNARRRFDGRDLEVLEVLCAQATAAIENARLEQQARKAEIVNVLGDISHDIKNMLTPISTGAHTLLIILDDMFEALRALRANGPQSASTQAAWSDEITRAIAYAEEDYRWILENALDSSDKLQARTKEIADAVKGELAPPVFEEADLNQTARDVSRSLRLVAEAAGVRLQMELDSSLPPAQFDSKQIYNALYNLVSNAIPATPQGGCVTIRTNASQDGTATALLEVQDTGCGIPEHVRERLFTDQAVSTKPGGTGLGTRIVAGVVHRHGASIRVNSEVGRGSVFSILLPLRQHATAVSPLAP